ncbi:TPA: restriction endonuclease subunit S [Campylobacter upsaliensis]|nr:restriction endonuclease subunit S [Campylobacter upsaliensis]
MKKHTQSPCERSEISYKPSSIKWLGEIPKHWEVTKFKYFYRSNMGETILTQDLETDGIPVYSATEEDKFFGKIKNPVNILNVNDFVIPARGTIGAIKIVKEKSTCTQTTIFSKQFKDINPYYVYYFLLGYRKFLFEFIQTAIPQITISQVNENPIILPPLQEQKEIAEFLDSKCEKIQNYIDKKQKLITLLQEKKQALINKIVTKGLNPNIESKNSGIEYLGLIPHHWEAVKVKFTAYVKGRIGFHGLNSNEFRYDEGAYLVTGNDFDNNEVIWDKCRRVSEERFYEDPNIHLQNNDLLITKDGTIGKTAIVNNCPKQATLNSGIFLVRTMKEMCFVKYLFFIINSQYFKEFVNVKTSGSTIKHLYQSDFHDLKIPLPPLQEQKQIANFLDKKCEKINSVIEKTKKQIELIKEYKNTLINEAVCGRINFLEGILNE